MMSSDTSNEAATSPLQSCQILATAGHVDHGKTTLVKRLTGTDTDTLDEEKARGLTINLGFAYYRLDEGSILGFVDVPGHTDFINNMLAGVTTVHGALLIIAADDGVMPQTLEHLTILDLLGIHRGAVVISKSDRVDHTRLESLQDDIQNLLAGTSLQSFPLFPVSAYSGDGIEPLQQHLSRQFGAGSQHAVVLPAEYQYGRYLIDRCFQVKGIGTVVTGPVIAGKLTPNTKLATLSLGNAQQQRQVSQARIKSIRLYDQTLAESHAGQRAALNTDLELNTIERGDWLLESFIAQRCWRFDAALRWLDEAGPPHPNTRYHIYIGASHVTATLRQLNESRFFQIKLDKPLHALYGDRLIVRDPASQYTLGGGYVLDVEVPRRGRITETRLAELEAMDQAPAMALQALLQLNKPGYDLNRFCRNRNLNPSGLTRILENLNTSCDFRLLGDYNSALHWIILNAHYQQFNHSALEQVRLFHDREAHTQGISPSALLQQLEFKGPTPVLEHMLEQMVTDGLLQHSGTLLHQPGHSAGLSEDEQQFLARIEPLLRRAGRIPPRTRELAEDTRTPLSQLDTLLRAISRSGKLVQVAKNRYFLPDTLTDLAALAETLAQQNEKTGFTVIQFRDASGMGRNLCIEVLEHFDGIGFTRRQGNNRFLRRHRND